MKPSKPRAILNGFVTLLTSFTLVGLSGFVFQPGSEKETTPTATPFPGHLTIPGSPISKINQTVYDQINERTASQKQAFGGDDFRNGKYERPFDPDMNYLPYADLVTIILDREDPLWIYVQFQVVGPILDNMETELFFMIEMDTDLDNHGDILVISGYPETTEWSTEPVVVLSDPDRNVGGVIAVKPDEFLSEGRGYFNEIFNNGVGIDPDLAWSRLSHDDRFQVELAFKNSLIGGEKGDFIWLPWTDAGMYDWSLFEHNDHFTYEQAGYPLKEDPQNYPIKALWGVDNTCRIPSGFTPTGYMPGLCPNYDPVPTHSDKGCPPCPPNTICPPC